MRIKINFRSANNKFELPINYNHLITGLIYSTLATSSHDFSSFLHDRGYKLGNKRFKLFTYSQLDFKDWKVKPGNDCTKIVSFKPAAELLVSSPVKEFVNHLAQGLLNRDEFRLGKEEFWAESVEILKQPDLSKRVKFICLSPIVSATKVERNGKLSPYYYRHDDKDLEGAIKDNLLKKYQLVHGETPHSDELKLEFDQDYIERKGDKIYKLIDFKGTKIKGILAPFVVEGSPQLIEIGYEAGFGEKGSMGFGMVEVVDK